jgi:hypothetical protein
MQQEQNRGRKAVGRLLVASLASLAAIHSAQAAAPWLVMHGPIDAREVPALSPSFNSHFPASKFEVFVYSDAFMVGELQTCHAIVGVSPRGSFQFPIHHYSATQTRPGKSMTVGESRRFALDCVTEALQNMLSDAPERVYTPYPSK